MSYFQFVAGSDELRAVPKTCSRLNSHAIDRSCNEESNPTHKVVYGSDSDEAPYTAIGFRAKKAGGTYKYIWLYKVKFAIPDENYTTKGDSIEFTTPEIVGQFIKRSDGLWKAEHVAEPTNSVATAWFTSVREPNNAGG